MLLKFLELGVDEDRFVLFEDRHVHGETGLLHECGEMWRRKLSNFEAGRILA